MRKQKNLWIISLLLIVFLNFISGCVHHKVEVAHMDEWKATTLSFLEDNVTMKNEVIAKLGSTYAEFEMGKIQIFWLDKKFNISRDPDKTRYHLVLVYKNGKEQILKEHTLVRIK